MNEDQIASLISEDEAKLIKEQIALKKKLNSINQQLKEDCSEEKAELNQSTVERVKPEAQVYNVELGNKED